MCKTIFVVRCIAEIGKEKLRECDKGVSCAFFFFRCSWAGAFVKTWQPSLREIPAGDVNLHPSARRVRLPLHGRAGQYQSVSAPLHSWLQSCTIPIQTLGLCEQKCCFLSTNTATQTASVPTTVKWETLVGVLTRPKAASSIPDRWNQISRRVVNKRMQLNAIRINNKRGKCGACVCADRPRKPSVY